MRFSFLRGFAGLLAASLLLPAGLWAGTATCQPAAPTPKSYTWDFPKEANQLFEQIRDNAEHVRRTAAELQSFTRTYAEDWRADANQLTQAKIYVNRMGADICRLQTIQRSVLPWQKKAIERMEPMVVSLVTDTQQAIVTLTKNEDRLFASNFRQYVNGMYAETRNIDSSVNRDVEYAKMHREMKQLKKNTTASGA